MFHNNGASNLMSRTPLSGHSVIHNDENAILRSQPLSHKHASSKNANTSSRKLHSISKPSFASQHTKTPLSNKTKHTRRRALGEISNRKEASNSNGNAPGSLGTNSQRKGGGKNASSIRIESASDILIYTPSKSSEVAKAKNVATVKAQTKNHQTRSSVNHSEAVRKKQVSFTIHTDSDLTSNADTEQENKSINRNKEVSATNTKPSLKTKDPENDMDDIELSAGRTWDEEDKIQRDHLEDVNLSIDVEDGLESIRLLREQDRSKPMERLTKLMLNAKENELDYNSILKSLSNFEDVDNYDGTILATYGDADDHVFRNSLDAFEENDDDLGHLLENVDDISI